VFLVVPVVAYQSWASSTVSLFSCDLLVIILDSSIELKEILDIRKNDSVKIKSGNVFFIIKLDYAINLRNIILIYLRGLEIAELKEEDMPMD
jgi:hypothetical protein